MTFTDPDYVSLLLADVITAVSGELTTAGRPIDVAVRFSGLPSWDCEMLAVWPRLRVGRVGTATDSDILRCAFKQVLDINILLLRCVTALDDGGFPGTGVVDADGDGFAQDMWILQRTITVGAKDGTLFTTACQEVRPNPVTPLTPQGTLSGMTTTLEVTL